VAPKSELVRLAISATVDTRARAVLDPGATMSGRGAYLCRAPAADTPSSACLQRALQRRAIPRALRATVAIDDELLESVGR
jgi:predicted RNA-binding protein YlxR (DUF448 family)